MISPPASNKSANAFVARVGIPPAAFKRGAVPSPVWLREVHVSEVGSPQPMPHSLLARSQGKGSEGFSTTVNATRVFFLHTAVVPPGRTERKGEKPRLVHSSRSGRRTLSPGRGGNTTEARMWSLVPHSRGQVW
jgi:hypothetical protein